VPSTKRVNLGLQTSFLCLIGHVSYIRKTYFRSFSIFLRYDSRNLSGGGRR